jgi:hypothetical protein
MSLKLVWKLRRRRVKLKADIFDIEMDIKAGFIFDPDRIDLKLAVAEQMRNEISFINSLLGENG